jgi:hypothetical protein
MALRVACRSGRSHDRTISDCHACGVFSFSHATAERSPSADRYLDLHSAAQCDNYRKPYGHHATNAHGDLHVAANSHPHCACFADPYANTKPDCDIDSDAFTATRPSWPSPHRDSGAAIGMKLAFQYSR